MKSSTILTLWTAAVLLTGPRIPAWGQVSPGRTAGSQTMSAGTAARMLGRIGRSGLRRFLESATMHGELQGRAASYRSVKQVEDARVAGLNGLISALDGALSNPALPLAERARLSARRSAAMAERDAAPEYETSIGAFTGNVGLLTHVASFSSRPVYLIGRGSTHHRGDREHRLSVVAPGGELGLLYAPTDNWVIGLGATLGGYDASVHSFDGTASGFGAGPRIDIGFIISPNWALGLRAQHRWSTGKVEIVRASQDGPIQVRSEQAQRLSYAQAELMGRVGAEELAWLPASLVLQPVVGVYHLTSRYDESTDSLGNVTTGTFGPRERLAVARASLSGTTTLGSGGGWALSAKLAYDYELTNDMDTILTEPHTLSVSAGLTRALGRSRRVSLSYTRYEGQTHRRTANDLTLAATLDF